jgi:flagellar basal-body rod protein FlgG
MMVRSLWTAASGMQAQQTNIDLISNDLSNVNTTGFKKSRASFSDLFYQRLRASGVTGLAGNNLPVGLQVGNGVKLTGTSKVFTQGQAVNTGIGTNMMIVDSGNSSRNFFPVQVGDGTIGYTRDGSFTKDNDGNLVLSNGMILDGSPQIPAEAQDITISVNGTIFYNDAAGDQQEAGQIQLATFSNPAGLEPIGDNIFIQTNSSGAATLGAPGDDGFAEVTGNYIEASNVSAIEEMVNMISAQRAYEFNSKSIQTSDEMLQTVNNLKR